jgi:hypothetical protein
MQGTIVEGFMQGLPAAIPSEQLGAIPLNPGVEFVPGSQFSYKW